jgi:hypothetical protein
MPVVGDYSELNELRGVLVQPVEQTGTRQYVVVDGANVLIDPSAAELVAANPELSGGAIMLSNAADVVAPDTGLQTIFSIPVPANKTFQIEFQINIKSSDIFVSFDSAGGYKVALTFPAGASQFDGFLEEWWYDTTGYFTIPVPFLGWEDFIGASGDLFAQGGGNELPRSGCVMGRIVFANGANPGNIIFSGAQLSTNVVPTIFRKTSWVRYTLLN